MKAERRQLEMQFICAISMGALFGYIAGVCVFDTVASTLQHREIHTPATLPTEVVTGLVYLILSCAISAVSAACVGGTFGWRVLGRIIDARNPTSILVTLPCGVSIGVVVGIAAFRSWNVPIGAIFLGTCAAATWTFLFSKRISAASAHN